MSSEVMESTVDAQPTKVFGTLQALGGLMLVAGGAGIAAGLAGGFDVDKLAPSFLFGMLFWVLLTMGCFGLSLLFHVTRGRWGTPVLRIFESGSNPMMLVYCLILVLVTGIVFKDPLYGTWVHPAAGDMVVLNKKEYLNYNFFLGRLVAYFVILALVGNALATWTKKEIATGDKKYSDKRNNLAAPGICIFILVMTFFITDILMSVDPHWFSTVWGFLFTVGSCLGALALATIITVSQRDKAPFAGKIDKLMMKDFGNLLLMLTMLWGYLSFSQLLIIWSGNLTEFIPFYLKRLRGNFNWLGTAMLLGQFAIPFLLLLSPRLKRSPALLIPAAGLIFLCRFVDMYWHVIPYFRTSLSLYLPDFGFLLAFGGIWFLMFGFGLKQSGALVITAHPYQGNKQLEEAPAHV